MTTGRQTCGGTDAAMPDDPVKSSKRVLDPIDRVSEVLFGLIMVLTFTGSLSIAEAGRDTQVARYRRSARGRGYRGNPTAGGQRGRSRRS